MSKKQELQIEYSEVLDEMNDIYENISYLARRLEELEVKKAVIYDELQPIYDKTNTNSPILS